MDRTNQKMKELSIEYIEKNKGRTITQPSWEDIYAALVNIEEQKAYYISLSLGWRYDEYPALQIFGEPHNYHISIFEDEESCYFYWDGCKPIDESVDLAGHAFNPHQICTNFQTVVKIVKTFYETGERSDAVQWLSEEEFCDLRDS